jgi:hypothetical protein
MSKGCTYGFDRSWPYGIKKRSPSGGSRFAREEKSQLPPRPKVRGFR